MSHPTIGCVLVLCAALVSVAAEDVDDQAPKKLEPPRTKLIVSSPYAAQPQDGLVAGDWVPIQVVVDNPEEAIKGRIVITASPSPYGDALDAVTFTTELAVEVPQAAVRTFVLRLPLRPSGDVVPPVLSIVLEREGKSSVRGAIPESEFSDTWLKGVTERPVLVLTSEGTPFRDTPSREEEDDRGFTPGQFGNGRIAYFQPRLDTVGGETSGLEGFSAIILHARAPDPSHAHPALLDGVVSYVLGGGYVVVAPVAAIDLYRVAPMDSLMPALGQLGSVDVAVPGELVPVDESGKVSQLVPRAIRATTLGVDGDDPRRRGETVVLAASDGTPLAIERDVGLGRVMWLAFDPAALGIREGFAQWLRGRIDQASRLRNADTSLQSIDIERWAFGLDTPPRSEIVTFLAVYLVLLGPGLFVLGALSGRRELVYLLVPVLALAFASAYYVFGYLARSAGLSFAESGAVALAARVDDGATARTPAAVEGFVSLYSPSNRILDIEQKRPGMRLYPDRGMSVERTPGQRSLVYTQVALGQRFSGMPIRARATARIGLAGEVILKGGLEFTTLQQTDGTLLVRLANHLDGLTIHGPTQQDVSVHGRISVSNAAIALRVSDGRPRPRSANARFDAFTLAPGESVTRIVTEAELEANGLSVEDVTTVSLEGEIHTSFVELEIDGARRENKIARHRLVVRALWPGREGQR